MKLAEALLIRKDLQNKLSEMRCRLNNNAIVQEGETPAEDPELLLQQSRRMFGELQKLMTQINLCNARVICEGKTMTELLAERDCLKQEISMIRDFLDSASSTGRRARGSEIKVISTVAVADIQKLADSRSAQLRKLEMKIQQLNWTTEIDD